MKKFITHMAAAIIIMLPLLTKAQNSFPVSGSAGIGTISPNASSILEMNSTTQGMLMPRMTKAQRDAIISPANGLMIYQTDLTPGFYFYDGASWVKVAPAAATRSLNNLNTPTAVNVDLLPATNNATNLGSSSFAWKNIYANGDVYIDGFRFLSNGNSTYNVFLGNDAGKSTTAGFNTGLGHQSLYKNSTGYNNTAVGTFSLSGNLGGYSNTVMGVYAMSNNTNGSNNSAFGDNALNLNTTGNNNTGIGRSTLGYNVGGSYNTALGSYAGHYTGDNTYCTFIGYSADKFISTNFTNSMALGAYSSISASNQVRIGSSYVTSIGGYTGWTNISDGRYKKDIKENVPGLNFINKLKPVTYHLDISGIRGFLGEDKKDEEVQSADSKVKLDEATRAKEKILYTGFVAQDVEKAAQDLGFDFSGVDKPQNENSLYGLRYAEFVVPLVKAVQELSKQNDDLQNQVNELKALIGKSSESSSINNQQTISVSQQGKLEQNQPNPAGQNTMIKYFVPQQSSNAAIKITSASGQGIKLMNVAKGNGQVTLQIKDLNAGTYYYSLIVDGKITDTKTMIIAH